MRCGRDCQMGLESQPGLAWCIIRNPVKAVVIVSVFAVKKKHGSDNPDAVVEVTQEIKKKKIEREREKWKQVSHTHTTLVRTLKRNT